MDENELRDALRTTMTLSHEPPPMDSAVVVGAGRRAARRRAMLASAGTAVALAAVTVGAVLPGRGLFGGGAAQTVAAQPMPLSTSAGAVPVPAPTAPGDATKPVWPTDGSGQPQQDATARSGPRYEQGKRLLDELLAVVPAGYSTPTGNTAEGIPLRDHQATVEEPAWAYEATAAIRRAGGTGRLLVEVHTPGNKLSSEPCALARAFWGMGGTCQVERVGDKRVGVVVKPGGDDRFSQWAAYRYADGTVVYVAQARTDSNVEDTATPLAKMPLTVPQLAGLAVDSRFHLS